MSTARIHDSKALLDTKAALVKFVEQVTGALAGMDADVGRVTMWLHHERLAHWKHEIRKREDAVMAAKTEIQRKIIAAAPEPVSLILERKAVARAQERVDEARRRLENTKRWSPKWEREAMIYKGGTQSLGEAINRDIPLAMNRLEKMLLALEAYQRMEAPSGIDGAEPIVASDEQAPAGEPAAPEQPGSQSA
jgi:hypothetical protein